MKIVIRKKSNKLESKSASKADFTKAQKDILDYAKKEVPAIKKKIDAVMDELGIIKDAFSSPASAVSGILLEEVSIEDFGQAASELSEAIEKFDTQLLSIAKKNKVDPLDVGESLEDE